MSPQAFTYVACLPLIQSLLVAIAAVIVWKHRAAGPGLLTVCLGMLVIVLVNLMGLTRVFAPLIQSRMGKAPALWDQGRQEMEFLSITLQYFASLAAWGLIAYGLAQYFRHVAERRRANEMETAR